MRKLYGLIINSRPYSWGDLVILGFLAKFSVTGKLSFEPWDFFMVFCLLSLWLFFNFILENRHNYNYRQGVSKAFSYFWLIMAGTIAVVAKIEVQALIIVSIVFVYIYLYKNKNAVLGIISPLIRGSIQAIYFIIASQFYFQEAKNREIISLIILASFIVRSIVGDLRDIEIDTKRNKITLPVFFGDRAARAISIMFLLSIIEIEKFCFGSFWVAVPAIVFVLTLFFYKNNYVLHQASIVFTTFIQLNMIAVHNSDSLILLNVVFMGLWFNFLFYPLLERK